MMILLSLVASMSGFGKAKNSKKQGDIGIAATLYYFSVEGYTVSLPISDSQDYDLIVDIEDKLYRVQVKTVYNKSEYGIYEANLRVLGGNRSGTGKTKFFDPKKVDYVFIVTEVGDMYFIPNTVIEGHSTISLGKKYSQYKIK
jgi:hypothetical protein